MLGKGLFFFSLQYLLKNGHCFKGFRFCQFQFFDGQLDFSQLQTVDAGLEVFDGGLQRSLQENIQLFVHLFKQSLDLAKLNALKRRLLNNQ